MRKCRTPQGRVARGRIMRIVGDQVGYTRSGDGGTAAHAGTHSGGHPGPNDKKDAIFFSDRPTK